MIEKKAEILWIFEVENSLLDIFLLFALNPTFAADE